VRALLLVVAFGCSACVTDTRRVADAFTSAHYLDSVNNSECVLIGHRTGSPELAKCQKAEATLTALKGEAVACEAAIASGKGHLPSIARKRLAAAKKAAEASW
jgi:hypothetical protein